MGKLWLFLPGILVLALLVGGGSTRGAASDAWLSMVGLVLLPLLLGLHFTKARPLPRGAVALALPFAALAVVALASFLPVTGNNDARVLASDIRSLAELDGPHPILGLDPQAAWRFLARLCLPLSIALGFAGAAHRERRLALFGIVVVAAASTLLAILQRSLGDVELLLPYDPFDLGTGGLFNNANHHGLFQSLGLLAAGGLYAIRNRNVTAGAFLPRRAGNPPPFELRRHHLLVGYGLWTAIGVFVSESGAAIILYLMAVATLVATVRPKRKMGWRPVAGLAAVALVVIGLRFTQNAFFAAGIESGAMGRLERLPSLLQAAGDAAWLGHGIGSFVPVYKIFEPLELLQAGYYNHAHNEPLQIVIEGGLVGLFLVLASMIPLGLTILGRARDGDPMRRALVRLLAAGVALVLLHSLIDYPLRTTSVACCVAVFLAIAATPAPSSPAVATAPRLSRRAAVGIVGATLAGLAGAILAWSPLRAEALASDGQYAAAAQVHPGHPLALAALAAGRAVDQPDAALSGAQRAIAQFPLSEEGARAVLVARAAQNRYDEKDWRLAGRLGWHDAAIQTVLAATAGQRGAFAEAADHAGALVIQNSLTRESADLLRPALARIEFRRPLTRSIGEDAFKYSYFIEFDENAPREQVHGAEALLRSLKDDIAWAPRHANPTLRWYLANGDEAAATSLYRTLFPDRAPIALAAYPQTDNIEERTPFDFFDRRRGDVRYDTEGGSRIDVRGQSQTNQVIASRRLAVDPGPLVLQTELRTRRGDARVSLRLVCSDDRVLAATPFQNGDVTLQLATMVPPDCLAPRLDVHLVSRGTPYRFVLDDWAIRQTPWNDR